jgi:hypothetical protein
MTQFFATKRKAKEVFTKGCRRNSRGCKKSFPQFADFVYEVRGWTDEKK